MAIRGFFIAGVACWTALVEKACSSGPGTSSASFPPVRGHQFLHTCCAPARSTGSDTHWMPLQPPNRSTVDYMDEAAAMSKALWKFLYEYKSKRCKLLAKTDTVKKLKLFLFRVCLGLHLPDHHLLTASSMASQSIRADAQGTEPEKRRSPGSLCTSLCF